MIFDVFKVKFWVFFLLLLLLLLQLLRLLKSWACDDDDDADGDRWGGGGGGTDPLSELARTAEIDDFDGRAFGVAEEDVLGLEIAVDDAQFGRRQEEQGRAQLLGELPRQVERHAAEVGVAQQVVQVVAE